VITRHKEKQEFFAVESIGKPAASNPDAPALKAYAETTRLNWLVER